MAKKLSDGYASHKLLKGILIWVGLYHILLGFFGIVAKDIAVSFAKWFFNFNLTMTQEIAWILNPFAAYVFIYGVFLVIAATDPVKYKNIIFAAVGLIAVRVIQRIIFFMFSPGGLIINADPVRNMLAIIVPAAFGAAIAYLALKIK